MSWFDKRGRAFAAILARGVATPLSPAVAGPGAVLVAESDAPSDAECRSYAKDAVLYVQTNAARQCGLAGPL